MAESKSACTHRVRKEAEARRREVYKNHKEEIRSISSDWKEGYAKLKEENDQRQKVNEIFLREQLSEIEGDLKEALGACGSL